MSFSAMSLYFIASLVSSKVSGFETLGRYGFRQAINPAVFLRHETRHTDADADLSGNRLS